MPIRNDTEGIINIDYMSEALITHSYAKEISAPPPQPSISGGFKFVTVGNAGSIAAQKTTITTGSYFYKDMDSSFKSNSDYPYYAADLMINESVIRCKSFDLTLKMLTGATPPNLFNFIITMSHGYNQYNMYFGGSIQVTVNNPSPNQWKPITIRIPELIQRPYRLDTNVTYPYQGSKLLLDFKWNSSSGWDTTSSTMEITVPKLIFDVIYRRYPDYPT